MAGLMPEESFTPTVEKRFGSENVLVIKDALGGQPIRRWYKGWKPSQGNEPKASGDLYERLMSKVRPAIEDVSIATVTFVWMQGERDAREGHGEVYADALKGLVAQLSKDLDRDDINFVNGRLSDFDLRQQRYQHWNMIRKVQVEVADSSPRYDWVDTDDLNDGLNRRGKEISNDLHYSAEGYKTLGLRFAEKSIRLIEQHQIQAR